MKLLRQMTVALGVAACFTMSAQTDLTPDVIFPKPGSAVIIKGLSDNGLWGVASPRTDSDEDGISTFSGAILYDFSGTKAVERNIGENVPGSSARDVTDDGKIVVGSVSDKPAYWKDGAGWTTLPMPASYRGGHVNSVTPDGHYGVGMVKMDNDGMLADGCMWDLTTNTIVEVPNMPKIDLSGANQRQNWFTAISEDGRYIFGTVSFSYPDATNLYVYDRNNDSVIYVGHTYSDGTFSPRQPGFETWETDVDGKSMSPSGRYISGVVDDIINGDDAAFIFDVFNQELKVTNGKNEINSWAWNVTEDGIGLCTRPSLDLYGECSIYYNNFYYPFADILKDVYGMNLSRVGIDNTGKPVLVSKDGKTIVFITSQFDSHIIRLKEDLATACSKLNLLSKWIATPANGTKMSSIKNVKLTFGYNIVAAGNAATKIKLLNPDGSEYAAPLANGGVVADGNTLTITFRSRALNEGDTYTLNIPAGTIWVDGKDDAVNEEINLKYIGRGNDAVKVINVSPENGAQLSSLILNENPVIITFDTNIQINEGNEAGLTGTLYIDEEKQFVSPLVVALNSANSIVVYPPYQQYLYKGSTYYIEIPAGVVVDLSGSGPSEAISLEYEGSYVPQVGNEQYLFYSTCDNYNNFLFFEGDHGTPTTEYADMGFTADETPWVVVRESEDSTDMAFGSHSSYTDGRQANDWVTTRQILVPEDTKTYLAFDAQSYRKNKEDYLKVYVYPFDGVMNVLTQVDINDILEKGDLIFNERLSPGSSEEGLSGDWTHYTYYLDDYAGKNIYICFVNDNKQQSMVLIDNIFVVREVKAVVVLGNNTNVVNKESEVIKGRLSIASEAEEYDGIEMKLKNANGDVVSTISDSKKLTFGDIFQFEFPQALPLEIGVANPFSIEYKLGDATESFTGIINDLTFEPQKRVVIEEFTGRDCQFCPGGLATMGHLEDLFGDKLIPVALHCYNGTDPKGANVMGYFQFTGMTGAPQAIVNRGMITAPLYYSQTLGHYVNTKADLSGSEADEAYLWKDQVIAELAEPALMGVELVPNETNSSSSLSFTATVKSAITLENQNVRVFGVLLEDNLIDYQVNAYYLTEDPLLGEWGLGGQFAQPTAMPVTFYNVARSTWGTSYNGTAGLIPALVSASEEYTIDFNVPLPNNINNVDNCKFAVMLINESTGKVINAAVSKSISGVENIADELAGGLPAISSAFGAVNVASATEVAASVYTLDGRLLGAAQGEGNLSIDLNGYNGIAIVKAQNASGMTSVKIIVK